MPAVPSVRGERAIRALTAMQLYCMQIGRLADAGRLTATVAGLAKMHNTRKARLLAAGAPVRP